MAVVRTNILSLGTSHPHTIHAHQHALTLTPIHAHEGKWGPFCPSAPCSPHELPGQLAPHPPAPWQAGGQAACHLRPALLLAQALKLDSALVALEAGGQKLLLELEKNQ